MLSLTPSPLTQEDSKSSGSDKESPHATTDHVRGIALMQSLRSRTGATRRKKGKQQHIQEEEEEEEEEEEDMMIPVMRSRTGATRRKKGKQQYTKQQQQQEDDMRPRNGTITTTTITAAAATTTTATRRKKGKQNIIAASPQYRRQHHDAMLPSVVKDGSTLKRNSKRTELVPPQVTVLANRIVSSPFALLFIRLVWRFRKILGPILLFLFLDHHYHFRNLYVYYFGIHPIQGGYLGTKLDNKLLQMVIDETHKAREKELRDMGVVLPEVHRTRPTSLLQINTNAAFREYLIRREQRSMKLIQMEDLAESSHCQQDHPFHPLKLFHHADPQPRAFPDMLLVPDVPSRNKPRPGKPHGFYHATFVESEMRDLIEDSFATLLETFDSLATLDAKIDLWAVCAVYYYGGLFLSNDALANQDIADRLVLQSPLFSNSSAPRGMLVFDNTHDIFVLAATPRHPHLRCLLNTLEGAPDLSAFFLGKSSSEQHGWEVVKTRCGQGRCCLDPTVESLSTFPADNNNNNNTQGLFYIHGVEIPPKDNQQQHRTVQVDISIGDGAGTPVKVVKLPIETEMKAKRVAPGWLCHRCLKTAFYGTFEKCDAMCPKGYMDAVCTRSDKPEQTEVAVDVVVRGYGKTKYRIPRIIHQTWFEDLSPDRYPQLVRLQYSWKNTGWDYRFYTDKTAREYIVEHFPYRFVDAFDAVIPGAYKADLFRYLVLLREGGLYADVDVMLDSNLDGFATESLSFFAARDVVCEYAEESFCLWNGIMGSAPGHPFLVRAAERVVNMVRNRADMYDLERDVCIRTGPSVESWKVRAEPLLMASGPCALGVAVNDALGRNLLSRFDIGWIPLSNLTFGDDTRDHGDALIMIGDKYDLGAFRISDPERTFMLASTDMPGVTKQPRTVGNPTRTEKRRLRKPAPGHYSEAAIGEFVWGMHKVYQDDLVHDEVLKFHVHYQE